MLIPGPTIQRCPCHGIRVATWADDVGWTTPSLSHGLSPLGVLHLPDAEKIVRAWVSRLWCIVVLVVVMLPVALLSYFAVAVIVASIV